MLTQAEQVIDYRAINTHYCKDMQDSDWNKYQPADGDQVRYIASDFMCLANDEFAGSQLSLCTPICKFLR